MKTTCDMTIFSHTDILPFCTIIQIICYFDICTSRIWGCFGWRVSRERVCRGGLRAWEHEPHEGLGKCLSPLLLPCGMLEVDLSISENCRGFILAASKTFFTGIIFSSALDLFTFFAILVCLSGWGRLKIWLIIPLTWWLKAYLVLTPRLVLNN